jgi:hypothetical protein
MANIFKLIEVNNQKQEKNKENFGFCIGINVQIADTAIPCPFSKVCHSYEDLAVEGEAILRNLENVLGEAKTLFEEPTPKEGFEFTAETSPEEIWAILSGIQDESDFVKHFNSLDDTRRREVADHVITKCNVFSGRGSVFSARFNNKTGYME